MTPSPYYSDNLENCIMAVIAIQEMFIIYSMATPVSDIQKNSELFTLFETNHNTHLTCALMNALGDKKDNDPYYNGTADSRMSALTIYQEVMYIYRQATDHNVIRNHADVFRQFGIYEKQFVCSVLKGIIKQENEQENRGVGY